MLNNYSDGKYVSDICLDIYVSLVHGQGLFFSITRGTKVYFIA